MPKKIKVRTSMVFERHEKKYLISEELYQGLLKRLQEYMHPDQFGLPTICSLYLDSDELPQTFHQSQLLLQHVLNI